MTIRVFRANTGSCGGCDAHVVLAIGQTDDLELVASPLDADVWLITGIFTPFTRSTLVQMLGELHERPRIIAIGQCALNGAPFGRGGLTDAIEIPITATLDGCPPTPAQIVALIRNAS
ncbi:MAG: NADH:ubiquinone oxidoreductase [Roseiflexaceae bacterium]